MGFVVSLFAIVMTATGEACRESARYEADRESW